MSGLLSMGLPAGYTIRDTGVGKNEILDANGNPAGTGYDDYTTALLEAQQHNLLSSITGTTGDDSGSWYDPNHGAGANVLWAPGQTLYSSQFIDPVTETVRNGWDDASTHEDVQHTRYFTSREELEEALRAKFATPEQLAAVYGTPGEFSPTHKFGDANYAEAWGQHVASRGNDPFAGGRALTPEELAAAQGFVQAQPDRQDIANAAESHGLTVDQIAQVFDTTPEAAREYFNNYGGNLGMRVDDRGVLTSKPLDFSNDAGAVDPGSSNQSVAAGSLIGLPTTVRGNAIANTAIEELRGEDALIGSTPVFKDGKVVGYKVDLALIPEDQQVAFREWHEGYNAAGHKYDYDFDVGDMGAMSRWNRRSSMTHNVMGRQLNEGWSDVALRMGENSSEVFVPVENADKIPGWKNYSGSQYENWAGGGFLEEFLPAIILGVATWGLGSVVGTAAAAQATAAGASAATAAATGAAATASWSAGTAMVSAAQALDNENWAGALLSGFGALGNLGAAGTLDPSLATLADGTTTLAGGMKNLGITTTPANMVINAVSPGSAPTIGNFVTDAAGNVVLNGAGSLATAAPSWASSLTGSALSAGANLIDGKDLNSVLTSFATQTGAHWLSTPEMQATLKKVFPDGMPKEFFPLLAKITPQMAAAYLQQLQQK